MRPMKRAIHLDFHTLPGIHDFNRDWDPKVFADRLKEAGVEYVNAFAKCNIGHAYYPTKIGVPYKGMKGDMFGDLLKECHRNGIGVSAYFSGGLDHTQALLHRDWLVENEEGQVIYGDRSKNFFRQMCWNSGYRDFMLGMVKELIEMHPDVDGIFIDNVNGNTTCFGNECRMLALESDRDPNSAEVMQQIRMESIMSFGEACKKAVGNRYLRLNGVENWIGRNLHTHAEIECLPAGWSYDFFPGAVAYARKIFDNVLYMTGRFQKNWGDFGGMKTKESMEYDIWDSYCNAVGISIGDHMHPAENLNPAVYDMVKELYDDVKRHEPYTEGANYISDIGVLINTDGSYYSKTHKGISRMLGELKYDFDIVNEEMDLSEYKLLILPDDIVVTPKLEEKLRAHIQAGKGIISSGLSGLNSEKTDFAMPEWGFDFDCIDPSDSSYFRVCQDSCQKLQDMKIPDMDWSVYSEGICFYAKEGQQVLAKQLKPYFNHGWDGFHGRYYTPAEKQTGHAALARCGNIYQFSFNVFEAYCIAAMKCHKQLVQYCIEALLPNPSFKQEGLPSTARLTLTQKDHMRIAHIKATTPEPRCSMNIIEEHAWLPAGNKIKVAGSYSRVYVAPDVQELEFVEKDGYTEVTLPAIHGYMMVVFEQ